MKKDKADSAQQSVLDLITASYPREAHDEEELDSAPRIINKQKLRDHQATRILTAYVDDYKYSSKRNRTYRSTLFWGGSILTALIVLVCLFLLVLWIPAIIQQDSEAASGAQTEQPDALDFEQLTGKVEALLSAPTESADAAALAQAITALIAVSTDAQDDTAARADRSVKNVVSLITVCLTLLAAVLGILKIIAQYAFQTNEQANVNEIVKALQVIDYNYKMAQMELSSGKTLENRHSMAVPGKDGAKA